MKTSCGCAKCRPALNYYLVCDYPGDYADDYQSRFINERVHANIQKDGTYSVVPRMWGGMTSASELRAIADVRRQVCNSAVKVTGGQRIDMLGIKKEDLPAVWEDLGKAGSSPAMPMPRAAHGENLCRLGLVPLRTQDSTGLGIRLEKVHVGLMDTGQGQARRLRCPRNCAEATCRTLASSV